MSIRGLWDVGVAVFSIPRLQALKLTQLALANVKRLVAEHKESLEAHSKLDFERIANVNYLYEFDRAVQ